MLIDRRRAGLLGAALLCASSLVACSGSDEPQQTVDTSGTFTPGIPESTSTSVSVPSSTTKSAINSDGSYKTVDALRAAVLELRVPCPDWMKATTVEVQGASDEGSCGPREALVLVTFADKDFNSSKVQQALTTTASRNNSSGSRSTVILRGKDWAALGTNETILTMNSRMGGEIVAPFNTTTEFGPPSS